MNLSCVLYFIKYNFAKFAQKNVHDEKFEPKRSRDDSLIR